LWNPFVEWGISNFTLYSSLDNFQIIAPFTQNFAMCNYSGCTGLSFLLKAIWFSELTVHVFLNTCLEVVVIVRLYLNYFSRCRFENIVSRFFCTGISYQYFHVATYSVLRKYPPHNLIISISILGYRHLPYTEWGIKISHFSKGNCEGCSGGSVMRLVNLYRCQYP
jgi:hypothetical protein